MRVDLRVSLPLEGSVGLVAVREVLRDWMMDISLTCPCYEDNNEIVVHVLFQCLKAMQVWCLFNTTPCSSRRKFLFSLSSRYCNRPLIATPRCRELDWLILLIGFGRPGTNRFFMVPHSLLGSC